MAAGKHFCECKIWPVWMEGCRDGGNWGLRTKTEERFEIHNADFSSANVWQGAVGGMRRGVMVLKT